MSNENKTYIGTYKIVRFFKSGRKRTILKGLTLEEAKEKTKLYKSNSRSFVGFNKQFTANKYFK